MRKEMTAKQRKVYLFIKRYVAKYQYPPLLREIADHMGTFIRAAVQHVTALERKGYIKRIQGHARTIRIIK